MQSHNVRLSGQNMLVLLNHNVFVFSCKSVNGHGWIYQGSNFLEINPTLDDLTEEEVFFRSALKLRETLSTDHLHVVIFVPLQVLQTRPGVSDVLRVKADSFS